MKKITICYRPIPSRLFRLSIDESYVAASLKSESVYVFCCYFLTYLFLCFSFNLSLYASYFFRIWTIIAHNSFLSLAFRNNYFSFMIHFCFCRMCPVIHLLRLIVIYSIVFVVPLALNASCQCHIFQAVFPQNNGTQGKNNY